jgi:hypothetical protein
MLGKMPASVIATFPMTVCVSPLAGVLGSKDAAFNDLVVGDHWLCHFAREQDRICYPIDEETRRNRLLGRGGACRSMAVADFWDVEEVVS